MSPLNQAAATTGTSIMPKRAAGSCCYAPRAAAGTRSGGKEPQALTQGDVVEIPAGVKHWHGAAADSWFTHLAVECPGENTSNEWLEPVENHELYTERTE